MIKVFISYSSKDKKFADKLSKQLTVDNINVWIDTKGLVIGENIAEKITDTIKKTDYFIIVLSKNSINSDWVNFELSAVRINEISNDKNIILPVLIEDCEIPSSLADKQFFDFRYSFDNGYSTLIQSINKKGFNKPQEITTNRNNSHSELYNYQIDSIKDSYNSGNLTLFCGAGISYDAGIPTWNNLLKLLLRAIYPNKGNVVGTDIRLADLFQKRINVTPLILAQYLKTLLGKKFTETVRNILYEKCNDKSKTIESIAELSRQKRNRKPLKAIITFNFDDLIEKRLSQDKTDFKSIFTEGERFREEEIPIFHPHGFLPRDKKLTSKNEIVFSEDTYHTQFIDPFSWGNLVQLNHLNNHTCLFIGVSLTDPNMRRLLDVAVRKNGKGEKNHYIIKKRYTTKELYPDSSSVDIEENKVISIIESIEEQDANNLGFNVIWIDGFNQIPQILDDIGS